MASKKKAAKKSKAKKAFKAAKKPIRKHISKKAKAPPIPADDPGLINNAATFGHAPPADEVSAFG